MEGIEAVIDAPETGAEVSQGGETQVDEDQQLDAGEQQQEDDSPYSPKTSKGYADFLKGLRDASPENAKWARIAKDDHGRLYQLNQLEPRGIDGVREKYALLDSVTHGDLKGADAISALQDAARDTEQVDQMIADGDERVLDLFGDEFNGGLSKLAPSLLARIQKSDPEGYANAIFPHLYSALADSPLLHSYNNLVDVMQEQPPSWLPKENLAAWTQEHNAKMRQEVARMSAWWQAQDEKAKNAPKITQNGNGNGKAAPDRLSQERAQFERQQIDHHFNTNIQPLTDKHAQKSFETLFRPYEKRLRLSGESKQALLDDFVKGVTAKAVQKGPNGQPNSYMRQMQRYRSQKGVDERTVANYFGVEFDKHARGVMDGLIKSRYGSFLNGKPKTPAGSPGGNGQNGAARGAAGPNVQIVTVKPAREQIDFKNTPLPWIHQQKYRLRDGKIVQVRQ